MGQKTVIGNMLRAEALGHRADLVAIQSSLTTLIASMTTNSDDAGDITAATAVKTAVTALIAKLPVS